MGQYMQYAQMAGQAMGGKGGGLGGLMGGGKGGEEDPAKLKGAEQTSMGKSMANMDALGQSFNNFADSEFAQTEQYNRQRAQGLPETNEPQLQDVQSGVSKLAGLFGGDPAPEEESAPDASDMKMDTSPINPDDEESKLAKRRAVENLMA